MPVSIETQIDIAAPPEKVWAVLTDFAAMKDWNPFIVSITGEPRAGAILSVTLQPPGLKPMSFKPTLQAVTPNRELRWLGRVLIPGLFDGEHRFVLEPISGGTRLTHAENFSGLLVPLFFGAKMITATRAGFEAMNRALKLRAES